MHFDIILPTTGRDSLVAAVESVVGQTHEDWSLQISCDGQVFMPGDAIPDLGPRFKPVVGSVEPQGGYGGPARNLGILMSQAESWIAYIDDDDEWLPNHLETLAKLIEENPGVNMVRTAGQSFMMKHKSPRSSKLVKKMGAVNSTDFLTVGMAHTREVFDKTDGWQPCDNHDHMLWKQMLASGGIAAETDAVTYHFKR